MHSYTVAVLEGGSEVVKASRCKYRGVGALSGPGNPSGNGMCIHTHTAYRLWIGVIWMVEMQ